MSADYLGSVGIVSTGGLFLYTVFLSSYITRIKRDRDYAIWGRRGAEDVARFALKQVEDLRGLLSVAEREINRLNGKAPQ